MGVSRILLAASLLAGCEQLAGFDDFEPLDPAAGGAGGAAGQAGGGGVGCAPPSLKGPAMVGRRGADGACRFIDETEVTRAHYAEFTKEKTPEGDPERPDRCRDNGSFAPSAACEPGPQVDPSLPVTCVDWCDAEAFCRWAGKRLCKGSFSQFSDVEKSEWYAACSGDGQSLYPYGKTFSPGRCNGAAGGSGLAAPRSFPECTASGPIFDLVGNAAEWLDACQQDIGSDDNCRAQGGSYRDAQAASDCAQTIVRKRSEAEPFVGFRCCAGDP